MGILRRRRWYTGSVDGTDRLRVSRRNVRNTYGPLDRGTWDSMVYPNGPLLSGSIEIGYFSFRNPIYPDKRIKYWRE